MAEAKVKAEKAPCADEPPADNKLMNSQNMLKLKLKSKLFKWPIPHSHSSPTGLNSGSCFLKVAIFVLQRKGSPINSLPGVLRVIMSI